MSSAHSVKLSAVIITFNEERNIGRCIDSLIPVVDEIIVLDSFSTDKTKEIVEAKGYACVQQKWNGYSKSKNFANSLTTGNFILSIDADEELSTELQKNVIAFRSNPSDVAEFNRLTNYCGRWIFHSGWYPDYKIRIFRKDLAEWAGDVHEELIFKNEFSKVKLSGNLHHYSYPTIESHLKKIITYSALAAEQDFRSGKKYSFVSHGLIKPAFTFIRKYFLKLGFLDGFWGFVIAINSSFERFLRYLNYRGLKN